MNSLSRTCFLVSLLIASLTLSGCAIFPSQGNSMLSRFQEKKNDQPVDDKLVASNQTVVVELHREGGLAGRLRVPVAPGMVVQDVLEGSGAIDQFDRMTIKVRRFVKGQQTYLPLTAVYDHDRNEVRPGSNYAIQPGDILIVTEDTSSSSQDMLQQLLGPLGGSI
jgi:hypothetical protein